MAGFGSPTAGAGSSVAIEKNGGAILKAHAAPFTAALIAPSATGGHVQAIQNGPGHYELIVWADEPGQVTLTFGFTASAANVYDPTVGTAPTKALGAVSGTTVALGAWPLIIAVQK